VLGRLFSGRYQATEIDGLLLEDFREDWRLDNDQIAATLAEAVQWVRKADPKFYQLITRELRAVVAVDSPSPWVSALFRCYYTNFPVAERRSTFYLACRLVWAAAFVQMRRSRPWYRRTAPASARSAGKRAQLSFVGCFPDCIEWVDYIERHED